MALDDSAPFGAGEWHLCEMRVRFLEAATATARTSLVEVQDAAGKAKRHLASAEETLRKTRGLTIVAPEAEAVSRRAKDVEARARGRAQRAAERRLQCKEPHDLETTLERLGDLKFLARASRRAREPRAYKYEARSEKGRGEQRMQELSERLAHTRLQAYNSRRNVETLPLHRWSTQDPAAETDAGEAKPTAPGSLPDPADEAALREKIANMRKNPGVMMEQMATLSRADASPGEKLQAVSTVRRLLSIENDPPIQEAIDAGLVPRLAHLLAESPDQKMQFEAAWAITNIASGSSEQTQVVIQHGCVQIFVNQLHSDARDVVEQVVWGLGNIAGDSPQARDWVLDAGALEPLCNILQRCQQGGFNSSTL